jgi:regulator of protease activity HflC (stomatin/prohibitin superfamily)
MSLLVAAIVLACLATLTAMAVKRVPEGQVYSLHRFGRPRRLLRPGLHLVLPLAERVAHRIDLGGQVLRFREPLAATGDDVRGTVYWQVLEPERADAVIEQADQLIRRGALDALRSVPGGGGDDRRVLGSRLKQALNGALRERGMMITRVDLDFA